MVMTDTIVTLDVSKDNSQAKKLYEEAVKNVRGGNIEFAIENLEDAHELDPENEDVMFRLAYLLDLRGSDERALEIYEILSDRQPVREGVLVNLAILYEDQGRYA